MIKDNYLNSLFDAKQEDLKNEKFVYDKTFNIDHKDFNIVITQEKEYYNIYILCDFFKKEPLNTLQEQIPITEINEDEITNELFLNIKVIEFYLWFKYGNPSENEVLSFNVEVIKT